LALFSSSSAFLSNSKAFFSDASALLVDSSIVFYYSSESGNGLPAFLSLTVFTSSFDSGSYFLFLSYGFSFIILDPLAFTPSSWKIGKSDSYLGASFGFSVTGIGILLSLVGLYLISSG